MGHIYKILNKVTNDLYIGSAINFENRRWHHIWELNNNKHHSPILQNSWNKHGSKAFEFIKLEEVIENENLVAKEQHYIDTLNPRYNCSKVAGSPLGVKHTLQSRLNMSKAHLGKKLKPESIAKRTAAVLGSKRSEETRQRMRDAAQNKRKVDQLYIDGSFIKTWNSIRDAEQELNIPRGKISGCAKGQYGRKTAGGFRWKYHEEKY